MIRTFLCLISFTALCCSYTCASKVDRNYTAEVRQPAVAGQFYPDDSSKLTKTIECYVRDAVTPFHEKPIAIISPHAGYIYSGQICADAFKQASPHEYDLVVLLGTNHTTAGFTDVSIYPGGGYQTPLGIAEIDQDLAAELIAADEDFTFSESVHLREHSIEVLVPFVQKLFPKAKILPAVIGAPDLHLCTRFGETLAKALGGRRALIVASSDLSHYPDYEDAVRVDRNTLDAIAKLDPRELNSSIREQLRKGTYNLSTCACGQGPILAAMVAAKKLGANRAQIISYANSGDTSIGRHSRVVGYGAVAFVADSGSENERDILSPRKEPPGEFALTSDHKKVLLTFARNTIRQLLIAETVPLARGFDPVLEAKKGVFVTLHKHGKLRGCIGHMAEDLPLCQAVGFSAVQAAFNDRRFSPIQPNELEDIEIEISVLTPFKQVGGAEDILIGRDGVMLEKEGRSAVYLPSVPVEQDWDREEMLNHLCIKAGLSPGCWKKGANFFTFQAMVFSESDLE